MPYANHHRSHQYKILIILAPIVLFWRWFLKGEVLFWGTPLFQFWPWHYLTKKMILAGEWPLWNPWLGNGTPLLANLQSAFFYPPNLLYLVMPVPHAFTLSILLHLIAAGLFMYAYGRTIHLTPFAATISALSFMLSGYIMGRLQFITMINAVVWYPLLLLLCEQIVTRRQKSDALWLGIVLALQLLAGHAQLWFYGLWLTGAYLTCRTWQVAKQRQEPPFLHLGHTWSWLTLATILALLLAAVQLLPTAEFTMQSTRESGAARYFALTYSFWPWRFLTLLLPNFFGHPAQGDYWGYANYWEDHAYLGTLPFILALIPIWRTVREWGAGLWVMVGRLFKGSKKSFPIAEDASPRRGEFEEGICGEQLAVQITPFFAIVVPLSLILALGWNTPVYLWVFDFVPGFAYFQAPSRLLVWYTVAMSILAGVGVQTVSLAPTHKPHLRRLLVGCIGLTLTGLAGMIVLSGVKLTFLSATISGGILLTLTILLLLITPDTKTSPAYIWWQRAVLLFVILDLFIATAPLMPTISSSIFGQPNATATILKAQSASYRYYIDDDYNHQLKFDHFFAFDTFGPRDMDYWQRFNETLVPNVGVYAHLPAANNDDPLLVGRWQRLVKAVEEATPQQRAKLLALMNVAYYIDDPASQRWPPLAEVDNLLIQQVPDPLPHAYFVPQAHVVENETAALDRLRAINFDSGREVVIMGETSDAIGLQQGAPDFEAEIPATITEYETRQVTIQIKAPTNGFVVLTDTFYPGWQAMVNDQPEKIWLANLAFRAVAVEAGSHEITFTYRPQSFYTGLWISALTLLILILIGVQALRKRIVTTQTMSF